LTRAPEEGRNVPNKLFSAILVRACNIYNQNKVSIKQSSIRKNSITALTWKKAKRRNEIPVVSIALLKKDSYVDWDQNSEQFLSWVIVAVSMEQFR